MIRAALVLYLALQATSPEAIQHLEAGRKAESERHFAIAVTEFRKVTELDPAFAVGFVSPGQACMEQRDYGSCISPPYHALALGPNPAAPHAVVAHALAAPG